jgi:hypothetical protein
MHNKIEHKKTLLRMVVLRKSISGYNRNRMQNPTFNFKKVETVPLLNSLQCRFTPEERDPAHWRGGWLGSKGGLGTVKRRISFLAINQISAKLPVAYHCTAWARWDKHSQNKFKL